MTVEIIGLRLLSMPKVLTEQGFKHSAKPIVLDRSLSKTWPHSVTAFMLRSWCVVVNQRCPASSQIMMFVVCTIKQWHAYSWHDRSSSRCRLFQLHAFLHLWTYSLPH